MTEIDMSQLKGTLIGVVTAALTFGHSKLMYLIDVVFQPDEAMEFAIKLLGFFVALAAIWMNVETAITRRHERRKIRKNEQETL